jgi:hypothetical protein
MKTLKAITGLAVAAASLGFAAQSVSAQALYTMTGGTVRDTTAGNTATGYTISTDAFTGNLGFDFTPTANVSVTSLGYFNYNGTAVAGAGLTNAHSVGLYDLTGTLLASTVIPVGSKGSADGSGSFFAYNTVTPVTLTAGTKYVLFGTSAPGDGFVDAATGVLTTGIAINNNEYNTSGTLSGTRQGFGPAFQAPGYFGPNAIITSAAVPEASSSIGLGVLLALGGLGLIARKRNVKA